MRSLLVGRDHVGCLYHDPTKEACIYLTSKVISASALRQRHSYLSPYSPGLNLIEILWRRIKYTWLPFSAYACLNALSEALEAILSQVGSEYQITSLNLSQFVAAQNVRIGENLLSISDPFYSYRR